MILLAALAAAQECQATGEVPEAFQVAWVSRVGATVGARTPLLVVRVADLRTTVEAQDRDATGVLQALGMVRKKGRADAADWKVTVFDVQRDWLCRPLEAGGDIGGVSACPTDLLHRAPGIRPKAWTGCGYVRDTRSGERTVDVYRVEWRDAVAWGFCVLPLERFLKGA